MFFDEGGKRKLVGEIFLMVLVIFLKDGICFFKLLVILFLGKIYYLWE